MKLIANALIFDINVKKMTVPEIVGLISQVLREATTIIVDSLSYHELDILAKIIIDLGSRANFKLPALANTGFYLNILEDFGVNLASLSFIDTVFTDSIVPDERDIIPSILVPATPRNLFIAIKNGDFNLVKQFLTDHPDLLTILTETNETLLHCAVKSENIEIVKYLLSLGADPTLCNKEGMSPANIAVKNRMPQKIVLPFFEQKRKQDRLWNQKQDKFYSFFHGLYPKWINSIHSKAIDTQFLSLPEKLEIISFLIKSEIFPSMEEKHILSEIQIKIRDIFSLAIRKSQWLVATVYLAYIKPDPSYINDQQLDLIVRSENIDLVTASLPYIRVTLSTYQLPSVTLTDNNTHYFTQLLLLLLVSGFSLTRIKEFSAKHLTLYEEINKPLPLLLRNARKIFDKLFQNIIYFERKVFSLNDLEELLRTLEENTDITQIQLSYCELDTESAGITLLKPTPEAEDLIKKILLKLYHNNFSLVNLVSLFLQGHNRFTQMNDLNEDKFLEELQSVLEPVNNILKDHSEYFFNIFVNCNKLIACIKQVTGLNYVLLACTDLSALTLKNLKSVYFDFFQIANETLLSQDPLSKILSDRLQAIANKLKPELEKRGVAIPDVFDIAISLIEIDDYRTLLRYIHQGKISIRARDKDNNTLLHHAVMALAVNSTRMLSEEPGCELDAINNQGETPFLLAIKSMAEDRIGDILDHLYEALGKSKIDPHASIPSTPLTIQNPAVGGILIKTDISIAGHDMQNRILYNFDLYNHLTGTKISIDELLDLVLVGSRENKNFSNLVGLKFTLEEFKKFAEKLEKVTDIPSINLSGCRLEKITEPQSNEILDNIIRYLFRNQCNQGLTYTQNFTLDEVITTIISIIETLKNEIDKPDISSLSLFNNTQVDILDLLHLFKIFGDILETQNRDLFTEHVILNLQKLCELLTLTPSLQNFPVFPILQKSCSGLNKCILELLSSLGLLESILTDFPEEQTPTLETTTLSEKAFIGDSSSPSVTSLSSSSIPLSNNIPDDIHTMHEKKYAISLLSDLKKIEMHLLPEMEMENYINTDRKEVESAIESLQNQLSKILDTLDGLIEKSVLIKTGKELQKKVDEYCNTMMGVNAYDKPHSLYCKIRSLAEQFIIEWEKILSTKTVSIPYSQNPAAFLSPPALQPSANSSSSPPACAQFSFLT